MTSYKQQMAKRGLSPEVSDEDYLKWWSRSCWAELIEARVL